MTKYIVQGGHPLFGEVEISGAKNAAVAILPAALLVDGICRIGNIPQISDVTLSLKILEHLGAGIRVLNRHTVEIDASRIRSTRTSYELARKNHIEIIDATCPVVLRLQKRIKQEYDTTPHDKDRQIVIYGKNGHAEVLGLVGQTEGKAIVIEKLEEVSKLDMNKDIRLYSQTTKSLDEFRQIVSYIEAHISPEASFQYFDTICRQVANRMPHIREFAASHDLVFFVCGHKSSNGKILFQECKKVNPNSYQIDKPEEIDKALLSHAHSIGICGATSTPKWLMEACKKVIMNE